MKKIVLFAITFVFAAAFGVAYASGIGNGITDFAGRSYDEVPVFGSMESAPMPGVVEGSNAGGLRSTDLGIEGLSNGITDFTGRSIDSLSDLGTAIHGVRSGSFVKSAPWLPAAVYDPGRPLTN